MTTTARASRPGLAWELASAGKVPASAVEVAGELVRLAASVTYGQFPHRKLKQMSFEARLNFIVSSLLRWKLADSDVSAYLVAA